LQAKREGEKQINVEGGRDYLITEKHEGKAKSQ
jgi:hypothetical protein